MTEVAVSGNTALNYGGGTYFTGSPAPTINGSTFEDNFAKYGGGIYAFESSPAISRSTISRNRVRYGGGGILLSSNSSPAIQYSAVIDNVAVNEFGGGIYCKSSSSPDITASTISGNRSGKNGGGIYCTNSASPTVVNSILWGNTADGDPEEIYLDDSSGTPAITVTYSEVKGGDPDGMPGAPWPGEGNIKKNPRFIRPVSASKAATSRGDYHLRHSSPCLDAGTGAGHDMGSDEAGLVYNGSFEYGKRISAPWRGGKLTPDDMRVTDKGRSGGCSFLMTGAETDKRLKQIIHITGSRDDLITLRGYSKASEPDKAGGPYRMEMKIFYNDESRETLKKGFGKKNHRWEKKEITFTAEKEYHKIVILLRYKNQEGQAWFDDIRLSVQPQP